MASNQQHPNHHAAGGDQGYYEQQHPAGAAGYNNEASLDASGGRSNPYASASQWRHQESSAYRQAAARQHQPTAREADSHRGVGDLADFLNASRIGPPPPDPSDPTHNNNRPTTPRFTPIMAGAAEARSATAHNGNGNGHENGAHHHDGAIGDGIVSSGGPPPDGKEIVCGPLLNYRRTDDGNRWIGSVLVVTKGGGKTQPIRPSLVLRRAATGTGSGQSEEGTTVEGFCLYSDPRNTFWRFDLSVQQEQVQTKWEYELPGLRFASKTKPRVNNFFVPAVTESMKIMFHSCNGFSVGTDEDAWSGAALWNDVMRCHQESPFHVMIGGGDQIYNDGIRVQGPLRAWTDISNPKKRQHYPFPESLRVDCDNYYLNNYIRWFGTEPFAAANGQIPQLNIWDDHDIIDGFGSYVNDFMKCDVFRGIGGIAHKYYMLFQHHLPPPPSTYTSDLATAALSHAGSKEIDPNQVVNTYVHPPISESGYIPGPKPGPYVSEHSHNMFAKLGARIAFVGIDARTERTRHQVNYPETYERIFSRVSEELSSAAAAGTPFKHLILLLGVPIAYPRLTWLENIFSSPVLGPIKFLNRRIGLGGSFFNTFDGSVDLLDDLDDHYTARTHKKERNWLIHKLQSVCAEFSVRCTILSGDVHLAAFGRFYSNPRLGIPTENDFRYIANVVSSAIVNKPPPAAVANLLARRNKIHHLDHDTDETLLKMFDKDPGDSVKTASHNQVTMPSRNFAVITENSPNNSQPHYQNGDVPPVPPLPGSGSPLTNTNSAPSPATAQNGGHQAPPGSSAGQSTHTAHTATTSHTHSHHPRRLHMHPKKDGHLAISSGEVGAGTKHKAADPSQHGRGSDGSLDVCIRIEIDQHDRSGRTEPYGLTIPTLEYSGPKPPSAAPPRPASSAASSSSASSREGGSYGVEHQQREQRERRE